MLAGELKAYNKRVEAGEVVPVQPPTPPAPPSLAGLHLGEPAGVHTVSQSLPSGAHAALLGQRVPPRPRMRGVSATASSLSEMPILELPEPSPHSCSLLDGGLHPDAALHPMVEPSGGERKDDDDFVGGTCALAPRRHSSALRQQLRPFFSLSPRARSLAPRVLPCSQEHA